MSFVPQIKMRCLMRRKAVKALLGQSEQGLYAAYVK